MRKLRELIIIVVVKIFFLENFSDRFFPNICVAEETVQIVFISATIGLEVSIAIAKGEI